MPRYIVENCLELSGCLCESGHDYFMPRYIVWSLVAVCMKVAMTNLCQDTLLKTVWSLVAACVKVVMATLSKISCLKKIGA